jgi:hypothetical protein
MKLYIYKVIILTIFLYILFLLTLGPKIDFFSAKVKNIADQQKRVEFKEKVLLEMKKGTEKENYFNSDEREIISNFLKKILIELDITTTK